MTEHRSPSKNLIKSEDTSVLPVEGVARVHAMLWSLDSEPCPGKAACLSSVSSITTRTWDLIDEFAWLQHENS